MRFREKASVEPNTKINWNVSSK